MVYMDNQQGPTIQHTELSSMLYDRVIGEGFGGEWIHVVCMAESLHCSPETIMAFLIGYTPTQNKKSKS